MEYQLLSESRMQLLSIPHRIRRPGCVAGAVSFFSGSSVMSASVVSINAAILEAFCSAERVTLVGSTTPEAIKSS
jgi:hypothetical protein